MKLWNPSWDSDTGGPILITVSWDRTRICFSNLILRTLCEKKSNEGEAESIIFIIVFLVFSQLNLSWKFKLTTFPSRLFNSFEFGNGSRLPDEKLTILEFKYLQNKKWYKQAIKVLEQGRVIKHTNRFHFTQITNKNLQFPFTNWRFSTFTTFSLYSQSSVDAGFCISLAYVTSGTKRSFWF